MKQVRANAVNGKMVYADGHWCTCIGNIPVQVGDLVWTDGRSVYGNVIEVGQPFVPAFVFEKCLPIFNNNVYFYNFQNSKLKKITENKPNRVESVFGMLNDKNKIDFISYSEGKKYIVDAEYGEDGIYSIEGFATSNYLGDNIDYGGNIYLDDIVIDNYGFIRHLVEDLGGWSSTNVMSARIDRQGNYTITVAASAMFDSTIFESEDGEDGVDYAQYNEYFLITNGSVISVDKWTVNANVDYDPEDEADGGHGTKGHWYVTHSLASSVKVPMSDGFYFTFHWPYGYEEGEWDLREDDDSKTEPSNSETFTEFKARHDGDIVFFPNTFYIYDKTGKLLVTLDDMNKKLYVMDENGNIERYERRANIFTGHPLGFSFEISEIKENKFLFLIRNSSIQHYGILGILENDQFIILNEYCQNFRLREMKNLRKWKQAVYKFIGQHTLLIR